MDHITFRNPYHWTGNGSIEGPRLVNGSLVVNGEVNLFRGKRHLNRFCGYNEWRYQQTRQSYCRSKQPVHDYFPSFLFPHLQTMRRYLTNPFISSSLRTFPQLGIKTDLVTDKPPSRIACSSSASGISPIPLGSLWSRGCTAI